MRSALLEQWKQARAATDVAYFAANFCYTLNKDVMPNRAELFPCMPWSIEAWDWAKSVEMLPKGSVAVALKSRRMMATWTVLVRFLHRLLFTPDPITLYIVSEKGELVLDKGCTTDSAIGKLEYMRKRLPKVWADKLHLIKSSPGAMVNLETKSAINGATDNDSVARGGGPCELFIDECDFGGEVEGIFESAKPAVTGPIWCISTINSQKTRDESFLARIYFGDDVKKGRIKKFDWHWSMHPDRDEEWYESACEGMTARQIAAAYDMQWGGSREGRCFKQWDRTKFVMPTPYIPGDDVWRFWDFGFYGTACLLMQVRKLYTKSGNMFHQFRIFDAILPTDLDQDDNNPPVAFRRLLGEKAEFYHHPRDRAFRIRDFGDPWAIESPAGNGWTWKIGLKENHDAEPNLYKVNVSPATCTTAKTEALIDNVSRAMRLYTMPDGSQEPGLMVDDKLVDLAEAFDRYSYPTNKAGDKITSEKPKKDVYSHPADALQYGIWHIAPAKDASDWIDRLARKKRTDTRDEIEELNRELMGV